MQNAGHGIPVRVVLYTDDRVLALGASAVFSSLPHFSLQVSDAALSALVPFVEHLQPEVILLDMTPDMTLGLVSTLRQASPESRLVLWGRSFSDELRYQALELGVAGFLRRSLSAEEFAQGLMDIAGGEGVAAATKPAHSTTISLTPRESQLVSLLVQGLKNKEIASCIGITEGTVRIYLSKLFAKIGARDRFELAVFGLKNSYCGQASWDGQNSFVTQSDAGRAQPVLKSLVLVEPQRRRGYPRRAAVVGE
jgi:DNA-binding NarL/FixJ family response regulator